MDCEMKVLVSGDHWDKVKEQIPEEIDHKKRDIWFFETPDLLLKQHEVVLRARLNLKKKEVESTAKWRRWVSPFIPVLDAWDKIDGFKAEVDATLTECVPAWSITRDGLDKRVFEAAQTSSKNLLEFFGDEQQLLVRGAWPKLPWESIGAYGPLDSVKWTIPNSVSIECWTSKEESIIEISKRGEDQTIALKEIRSWLHGAGVAGEEISGGKTAWALRLLVPTGGR
jgi:hypothetical protein